jgi:hypothetical protein
MKEKKSDLISMPQAFNNLQDKNTAFLNCFNQFHRLLVEIINHKTDSN